MTIRLSEDLRDILSITNELTVRLYDDRDQRAYVVIPEAIFERMCASSDDDLYAELYPHLGKLLTFDGLGSDA